MKRMTGKILRGAAIVAACALPLLPQHLRIPTGQRNYSSTFCRADVFVTLEGAEALAEGARQCSGTGRFHERFRRTQGLKP